MDASRLLGGAFAGLAPLTPLLILACAEHARRPPPSAGPRPVASSQPAVAEAKPGGGAGDACRSEAPFERGDCAEGLACAPFPGGYCFRWCTSDVECGDDARCVPSPQAGQVCARACGADSDCRPPYRCDAAWQACSLPEFLAPRAATCGGSAPAPRKRFSPSTMLSTGASSGQYSVEAASALNPDGSVSVVFMAMAFPPTSANQLAAVKVPLSGEPEPPIPVPTTKPQNFDPWLAVDGEGATQLLWLRHDGGRPDRNPEIAWATSRDGRTFGEGVPIHAALDCPPETAGCLDKPMLVRSGQSMVALYYSEVTEGLRARLAPFDVPSETSTPVGEGAYGDVFADGARGLHVSYVASGSGDEPTSRFGSTALRVEYVSSTDGGRTFSTPARVSRAGESIPFYFSNPQVLFDAKRRLGYVLYPSGGPDLHWTLVLARSADGGKTWAHTPVQEDDCTTQWVPSAALDPNTGDIHVIWSDNRAGVGRLVYTRCKAGGESCAPAESVNDRPFAAFSAVRHAPAWRGEYDGLLLDSTRRLLHAVWTQPVLEDGKPVSRIFYARASL